MGFWSLFEVASMPIVQVLILSLLGALMATNYLNLLPADARKSLNKVSLKPPRYISSHLHCHDLISWFMLLTRFNSITDCVHGVYSVPYVCKSSWDCHLQRSRCMVWYTRMSCLPFLFVFFSFIISLHGGQILTLESHGVLKINAKCGLWYFWGNHWNLICVLCVTDPIICFCPLSSGGLCRLMLA